MDGLFSFQCRSLKSIRDALGGDTLQTSTILLTTSRKNSFDQTFRASGFFTKGSTSFFIWFTSSLSIACDVRKENSSLVRCSPSFTCPLCIILRSRWPRCSCGWYEAYHTRSYQSRPLNRLFHCRQRTACILPANRSGRTKVLTENGIG